MNLTTEEIIAILQRDDVDMYGFIVRSEASYETWVDIIQNYPQYRYVVAANKTVPESIIRYLFKFNDDDINYELASKRRTPKDILFELATHPNESIRNNVFCNPKCPIELEKIFLNDPSEFIRGIAREYFSK